MNSTMHKIRLYVVPEEINENDDPDDIDLPALQRKNSLRPGAVRVSVIPKTAIITKMSNDENEISDNNKVPLRISSLSNGRVLASPRIRKIAQDLQDKMLEHHRPSNRLHRKTENHHRKCDPSTKVGIKNSRIDRNSSPKMANVGSKRSASRECPNTRYHSHTDGNLPKIVRVKGEEEEVVGMENSSQKDHNGHANLAILRRNNKLNGYREYDLEQKIQVEIKMREGSARLLAAAKHRAQSLEAARAHLTSNERMSAYMAELQRRKREPAKKPTTPVSTARVSLSELRVPLMWRDSDHFKNRGDYRRFAVFCLARIGTEIHDTALLCPVDRALTDITFPDVVLFNNIPSDFELVLEIYSHILQEDLSIASTPRRIKRTIHSSISKTVGKKLVDDLNSGKIGPHFELVASAKLTLDDTNENIHTHDLVINSLENKQYSLPLFGHFCCRLAAQPDCMNKEICSGSLCINGKSCWARVQNFQIQSWNSRKLEEEEQNSVNTIQITKETTIQSTKLSDELIISNTVDGTDESIDLKFESPEEAQKWLKILTNHAKDHERWRHAAESPQQLSCIESARNSFISNKRQGSLYDETPLIESVQSDYPSARPTVQEIFGLTPSTSLSSCSSSSSPPSLRSRSLSTSSTRKISASAIKSHWPFFKNHD